MSKNSTKISRSILYMTYVSLWKNEFDGWSAGIRKSKVLTLWVQKSRVVWFKPYQRRPTKIKI